MTLPKPILRATPQNYKAAFQVPMAILMVSLVSYVIIFAHDRAIYYDGYLATPGLMMGDGGEDQFEIPVDDDFFVAPPPPPQQTTLPLVSVKVQSQTVQWKNSTVPRHHITQTFSKPSKDWRKRNRAISKNANQKKGKYNKRSRQFSLESPRIRAPTPKIGNRTIFFLHIHKSGGSTMCQMAKRNAMTANFGRNCNVQPDQQCCGNADTLAAQQSYANRTKFSFVAAEKSMYQSMDLQNFYYVVTLRNSHSRYISHYHHVQAGNPKLKKMTFAHWFRGQPDNWNTRMICGPSCSNTPKYQITSAQFQATLTRLQRFESILFLEDFLMSYQRFCQKVGWRVENMTKQENKRQYNHTANDGWDPLMSTLDDALYQVAQKWMNGERNAEVTHVADYFEHGPTKNCSNACCGTCSGYRK